MATRRSNIPEHFLHKIWQDHKRFIVARPHLADGSPILIADPGTANDHRGGPDFLDAAIALGGVAVKGDVELHTTEREWVRHGHSTDARYARVVLHVVLEKEEHDAREHQSAPELPTLVIRDNLAFEHTEMWDELFRQVYDRTPELACFPHNLQLPMKFKRAVLSRMGDARLEELASRFDADSLTTLFDQIYTRTLDALGFSENRKPFVELSKILPRSVLIQVRSLVSEHDRSTAFEALFFGAAGLLPQPALAYSSALNERLLELRSHWERLTLDLPAIYPLAESDWAFFRIRPLNTPYRRIAYAAHLASEYFSRSDSELRELQPGGFLQVLGDSDGANSFWERMSSYTSELPAPHSLLGEERKEALVTNVVLPAHIAMLQRFPSNRQGQTRANLDELARVWGERKRRSSARYVNLIEQELLEAESVKSVRSEQGALNLVRNFCEAKRCSECPVGERLAAKGWKPGRR